MYELFVKAAGTLIATALKWALITAAVILTARLLGVEI